MRRFYLWSGQWVFYLTTVLLLIAVVLRSVLVYGDSPELLTALALLFAWTVLFLLEPGISQHWPTFFPFYLGLQVIMIVRLLSLPGYPDSYAILFLTLTMQVTSKFSRRMAILSIAMFAVLAMVMLIMAYGTVSGMANGLIYIAGMALSASFADAARRAQLARARNEGLAREQAEANRRLQSLSAQRERLAAMHERQRLARDLHDSVTQTIFSMTLTSQTAQLLLERDPVRVVAQLDRLEQLANNVLAEMRVLISRLDREPVTDKGLAPALRELLGRPEMEALNVTLEVSGCAELSQAEEQGLFRIAQEALNNIIKHAGTESAWARVCLENSPSMEIEDQGCGFKIEPGKTPGVGLKSMSERAAEIGWTIDVDSQPGRGTRVRVEKRLP